MNDECIDFMNRKKEDKFPDTSMEYRIQQNIKKLSKPKKGVQMV
jgi:hypothetical protein